MKDSNFPIETNGKSPDKSSDKQEEGKGSLDYFEYTLEYN